MNISPMSTPESREDFERRVHVLREQLRLGKLLFSEQVRRGPDQLLKMRLLPNGRVDLLSIDESARLMANMTYGVLLNDDLPFNMADPPGDSTDD
jgi:hypothetical protein